VMVPPLRDQAGARRDDTITVVWVKTLGKKVRTFEPVCDGEAKQPLRRVAHEAELEGRRIPLPDHAIEATQQVAVVYFR
jgi:hypothetical protein